MIEILPEIRLPARNRYRRSGEPVTWTRYEVCVLSVDGAVVSKRYVLAASDLDLESYVGRVRARVGPFQRITYAVAEEATP